MSLTIATDQSLLSGCNDKQWATITVHRLLPFLTIKEALRLKRVSQQFTELVRAANLFWLNSRVYTEYSPFNQDYLQPLLQTGIPKYLTTFVFFHVETHIPKRGKKPQFLPVFHQLSHGTKPSTYLHRKVSELALRPVSNSWLFNTHQPSLENTMLLLYAVRTTTGSVIVDSRIRIDNQIISGLLKICSADLKINHMTLENNVLTPPENECIQPLFTRQETQPKPSRGSRVFICFDMFFDDDDSAKACIISFIKCCTESCNHTTLTLQCNYGTDDTHSESLKRLLEQLTTPPLQVETWRQEGEGPKGVRRLELIFPRTENPQPEPDTPLPTIQFTFGDNDEAEMTINAAAQEILTPPLQVETWRQEGEGPKGVRRLELIFPRTENPQPEPDTPLPTIQFTFGDNDEAEMTINAAAQEILTPPLQVETWRQEGEGPKGVRRLELIFPRTENPQPEPDTPLPTIQFTFGDNDEAEMTINAAAQEILTPPALPPIENPSIYTRIATSFTLLINWVAGWLRALWPFGRTNE